MDEWQHTVANLVMLCLFHCAANLPCTYGSVGEAHCARHRLRRAPTEIDGLSQSLSDGAAVSAGSNGQRLARSCGTAIAHRLCDTLQE